MSDPQRTQIALLRVAVGLLAAQLLLTLAVLIGAVVTAGRLADATGAPLSAVREDLQTTRQLARELTDRQASMAAGLDAIARETAADLKALRERRNALGGIQRGPVDKIDQVIGLMQLLADELLVMLDHVAASQGVLARTTRPGETQRELVKPAPPDAGTP